MRAAIINLEVDLSRSGVFRRELRDLGVQSFGFVRNRVLGRVCCSMGSRSEVSSETEQCKEETDV